MDHASHVAVASSLHRWPRDISVAAAVEYGVRDHRRPPELFCPASHVQSMQPMYIMSGACDNFLGFGFDKDCPGARIDNRCAGNTDFRLNVARPDFAVGDGCYAGG